MIKHIRVCDKCGYEEEYDENKLSKSVWTEIKFQTHSSEFGNEYIKRNLCSKCSVDLGLKYNNGIKKSDEKIGDRLIEILTEIAQGVQQ